MLLNSTSFEIDPVTAQVQSLRSFDYEMEPSFVIELVAMDNATTPLTDTALLTIYISDQNDNDPFFVNLPSSVNYSESTAVGSFIADVEARDLDSGVNSEVMLYRATYVYL